MQMTKARTTGKWEHLYGLALSIRDSSVHCHTELPHGSNAKFTVMEKATFIAQTVQRNSARSGLGGGVHVTHFFRKLDPR